MEGRGARQQLVVSTEHRTQHSTTAARSWLVRTFYVLIRKIYYPTDKLISGQTGKSIPDIQNIGVLKEGNVKHSIFYIGIVYCILYCSSVISLEQFQSHISVLHLLLHFYRAVRPPQASFLCWSRVGRGGRMFG